MYDLVIRNGIIFDGSGKPGRPGDVGICGERIAALGSLDSVESVQVIDAHGLAIAPGFIDVHSHADSVLPFLPTADSKIHQGITLEVVGNCGDSIAPLSAEMLAELNQDSPHPVERRVDWLTFEGFVSRLRKQGTSVNVAPLVGHGTIRRKVMGMTDAAPTGEELRSMQEEIRQALEVGAVGMSTGLIYTPNVYAGTDEIVALAQTAAACGGIYTTHVRGEGDTLLEAIDEAITIGREAGIKVEISHLKAAGVKNWHKMALAMEKIERARAEGLDVAADMYSYNASNTGLTALVPGWVHVGGRDAMIARLKDPAIRARLHADLPQMDTVEVGFDQIFISDCPSRTDYQGRHLAEIAAERGQHPWDAVMDILIETRLNADIIEFTMKPENVTLGLKAPYVSICTDSGGRSVEGVFSKGKPHPRNYGSFPRVLAKYTREEKLFPLEEAVRKMTGQPAGRLGLKTRGLLREGYFADVVIFDPQTVRDTATFTDPHHYPEGIPWVIVNGKVVIANGRHTGALPGQMVRCGS